MSMTIDFDARILAALRGQIKAAVSTQDDVCTVTGQPIIHYGVTIDTNNCAFGNMSKAAFDRWVATGMSRDVERIAAYARVGLDYDGAGGEPRLMSGWTWDQHDSAVMAVNA